MARDYLAIPATSASSERVFSTGRHLISDTRNCLSAKTIQACLCLKSWFKNEKIFNEEDEKADNLGTIVE